MSDLIDRQAAIEMVIKRDANCGIDSAEVLKDLPSAQIEEDCQKCIFCGFPGFKQFQTAQPEIIRCKDCKWFNTSINQCNRQIAAVFFENDFCSYAERLGDD